MSPMQEFKNKTGENNGGFFFKSSRSVSCETAFPLMSSQAQICDEDITINITASRGLKPLLLLLLPPPPPGPAQTDQMRVTPDVSYRRRLCYKLDD